MEKTAGIIIIGDEVLSGKVTDVNSTFLCKRFQALGLKVRKISIVPDDVDVIASEVATFSKSYDIVITTGGIGPTHDDVTFEAIAKGFNVPLIEDKELRKYFKDYVGAGDSSALRMIRIPTCSEVIFAELEEPLLGSELRFPVVKTANVFTLAGVPKFVERTVTALQDKYFRNPNVIYFSRAIHFNVDEILYVTILNEVIAEFKGDVVFGSYPRTSRHTPYLSHITVESASMEKCLAAESAIYSRVPPSWIFYVDAKVPDFELMYRISSLETRLSEKMQQSFQVSGLLLVTGQGMTQKEAALRGFDKGIGFISKLGVKDGNSKGCDFG